MVREKENGQKGFSVIEVAIASVISMVGMIFLASLFTLAVSQNRIVKQFTSTTALAQDKLEELSALEKDSDRLTRGGDLYTAKAVKTSSGATLTYSNNIFVDDSGKVLLDGNIPAGRTPHYRRYWSAQDDPALLNTVIISVRVVSLQSGRNSKQAEETTLTTVRSW
ncbi:MAG TPA: hypothetical protein VNI02_06750 [Blastocatellia bacterium]|jgi:Tfp pilus assembly protein PilV|nr:hypothetical protein [Blastocatellia bacterium]